MIPYNLPRRQDRSLGPTRAQEEIQWQDMCHLLEELHMVYEIRRDRNELNESQIQTFQALFQQGPAPTTSATEATSSTAAPKASTVTMSTAPTALTGISSATWALLATITRAITEEKKEEGEDEEGSAASMRGFSRWGSSQSWAVWCKKTAAPGWKTFSRRRRR